MVPLFHEIQVLMFVFDLVAFFFLVEKGQLFSYRMMYYGDLIKKATKSLWVRKKVSANFIFVCHQILQALFGPENKPRQLIVQYYLQWIDHNV